MQTKGVDKGEETFHEEDEDGAEEEHADEGDEEHKAFCTELGEDAVDFGSGDAANEEEGFSESGVGHVEGEDSGVADGVADAFDEFFDAFHEAFHHAEDDDATVASKVTDDSA